MGVNETQIYLIKASTRSMWLCINDNVTRGFYGWGWGVKLTHILGVNSIAEK